MNSLPVARVVNVSIVLSPQAAQSQNLSSLLVLQTNPLALSTVERMRSYSSAADVAADFGAGTVAALAANAWFGQTPSPTDILIGTWAKDATPGYLFCGPLTPSNRVLSAWTAISNGSFGVNMDGAGVLSISGLDFSGATSLAGVAAVISTALDTAYSGAGCVYDAVNSNFVLASTATPGPTATVSFLTAGASGTDIATKMVGTDTAGNGAYLAPGIAAETAPEVVGLFENQFGQQWYALVAPDATDDDHQLIAPVIEASGSKHIYGVTTQEAGALSAVSTTDIAYLLKQGGWTRTCCQYSSNSGYAICSYLGRKLTVDYNGNSTAITLKFKQEPGIIAENLTSAQADALKNKNCNVFAAYENNTAIIQEGTQCSGLFTDIITDIDAYAVTLQTALYNVLYLSQTKIPQTDAGMQILTSSAQKVSEQFYTNGVLGTGVWDQGGFGTLQQGDVLPHGYYVYIAPVASQTAEQRGARIAPPIQIAAKLAGAVHFINTTIYVNQ